MILGFMMFTETLLNGRRTVSTARGNNCGIEMVAHWKNRTAWIGGCAAVLGMTGHCTCVRLAGTGIICSIEVTTTVFELRAPSILRLTPCRLRGALLSLPRLRVRRFADC